MARLGSSAFGSSGSTFQLRSSPHTAGHFLGSPVQVTVCARKTLLFLLGLCLIACWAVLPALAQDEVHVTPR